MIAPSRERPVPDRVSVRLRGRGRLPEQFDHPLKLLFYPKKIHESKCHVFIVQIVIRSEH